MNKESLKKYIDAFLSEDEDAMKSVFSEYVVEAGKQALKEIASGKLMIKGDDVFVGGERVGNVQIDENDETPVTFKDSTGNEKEFESYEDFHAHLRNTFDITESLEGVNKALKYRSQNPYDRYTTAHSKNPEKDGSEGLYKKVDITKTHKDKHLDKPKGHDHGHDDESGFSHDIDTSSKSKKSSSLTETNPPDKEHELDTHKDKRMENPKKHDHGHDDPSGTDGTRNPKSGKNPPDKEHELDKHKDKRMEKPKGHDHGHDDESGKDENPKKVDKK